MNKPAFTIHLEDEQFLIVEKPPAMHTAPLRTEDTDNLLTQVISFYPEIASLSGKKNVEPGLLHRLDYETSGLVLIACTEKAFVNLSEQFKHNQVTKCYYTVSLYREEQLAGSPLDISQIDWRRICQSWPLPSIPSSFMFQSHFRPWGPGRKQVKVITDDSQIKKQPEVTPTSYTSEFRFLKHRADRFLLEVTLTKGFRHQVRSHLAYLGLPIAGDPLYLKTTTPQLQPPVYARMYLHAAGLKFRHPLTGEIINYRTPVPEAFEALLSSS